MSSRGNQRRGPNRNSEISEHGEEVAAWKEVKDKLPGLLDTVNHSSAHQTAMYEQDKLCAEKKKTSSKCISACPYVIPIMPTVASFATGRPQQA
jgi:SAGA-associated factor 29